MVLIVGRPNRLLTVSAVLSNLLETLFLMLEVQYGGSIQSY